MKKKKEKKRNLNPGSSIGWFEDGEMHALLPGEVPSKEQIEEMTKEYQRQIRKSPLFTKMVKQYGKTKAEELLKECKIKLGE